ncbi:MAG TPA: hypothetical protein V6D09_01935 [Leptolyngbyaceae cyanobacterium]
MSKARGLRCMDYRSKCTDVSRAIASGNNYIIWLAMVLLFKPNH